MNESLMVRSERKAHPLAFLVSMVGTELPSFEEILAENYQGSLDNFWKKLISISMEKKYTVYVDSQVMIRLMLQFWKSIFKEPSVDALFRLYNFSILDNKLKSFLIKDDRTKDKSKFNESIYYLSKEEFLKIYENTPRIECLMELDKSILGFEYLVANYYATGTIKYKDCFEDRIGELAWLSWFDDIQILRSELLTGFYNLNKLLPDLNLNLDEPVSIEQTILNNKYLAWMIDPKFRIDNKAYIIQKYGKKAFNDLNEYMFKATDQKSDGKTITDNQMFFNYQVSLTNFVFDGRFDELVKDEIANGFGSQIINNHLQHKVNQLFVSYVYDKARSNEFDSLQEYELL